MCVCASKLTSGVIAKFTTYHNSSDTNGLAAVAVVVVVAAAGAATVDVLSLRCACESGWKGRGKVVA